MTLKKCNVPLKLHYLLTLSRTIKKSHVPSCTNKPFKWLTYCRLSHLVDRVVVSRDQPVTLIPFYSVKHAHHGNSAYR